MKNKICTAIATLMLFIPWTILPLRTFDWALESPAAEIIIYRETSGTNGCRCAWSSTASMLRELWGSPG